MIAMAVQLGAHVHGEVRDHGHQRPAIRRGVHHLDHVHGHVHVPRRVVVAVAACGGAAVGRFLGHRIRAVPQAFLMHRHVAVADHPLAGLVHVIAHHADGRMRIGARTLPILVRRRHTGRSGQREGARTTGKT
jgi:hypothetical protein